MESLFQKRHKKGQQAHENMLSITNQENANENHNDINSYSLEWLSPRRQETMVLVRM